MQIFRKWIFIQQVSSCSNLNEEANAWNNFKGSKTHLKNLTYYIWFWQTGVELELADAMPLLEWFANNYKNFGATLEIITDRSQEGAQFVKGFGGIGGMEKYCW